MADGSCSFSAWLVPKYCHAYNIMFYASSTHVMLLHTFKQCLIYINVKVTNLTSSQKQNKAYNSIIQLLNQSIIKSVHYSINQSSINQTINQSLPTSACSGFFFTAASNSRTALGISPRASFSRPAANGSGCSARGLSSSNLYSWKHHQDLKCDSQKYYVMIQQEMQ